MTDRFEKVRVTKTEVLDILRQLDQSMTGVQRKIQLYCLGGTVVTLSGKRHDSKDLDFLLSRRDLRFVSTHAAPLMRTKKVQIDFFPDGEFAGYEYPTYMNHAVKLSHKFDNIELFRIDDADFALTKALAGRPHDYDDIRLMNIKPDSLPKELLLARFDKIKPEQGKEQFLREKIDKFIQEFYQ